MFLLIRFWIVPIILTVVTAGFWTCRTTNPVGSDVRDDDDTVSLSANGVKVIALTDFHGAVDRKQGASAGGGALLAVYLKDIERNSRYPTFTIDAGDLFTGSMVANESEGAVVVDLYKYMGVDAVAIGNHEFDFGPEGRRAMVAEDPANARQTLEKRMEQAAGSFEFLAANLFVEDERGERGDHWAKPSTVLVDERTGLRVGVIGLTSTSTASHTNPKHLRGLHVPSILDEASVLVNSEADRLLDANVDFIILTMHDSVFSASLARPDKTTARESVEPNADQCSGCWAHPSTRRRLL